MQIRFFQIAQDAVEFIKRESERSYPLETGGILVGKVSQRSVIIAHAIGPGVSAQRSISRFRREGEYSQHVLDGIVDASHGEMDYVGEWHSHPALVSPSDIDLAAMNWIARNQKYAVDSPVMALCSRQSADSWLLALYVFKGGQLHLLKPHPKAR